MLRVPSSVGLNPLNAKLNPIFHLLALLGAQHMLHVSRIRVKEGVDICNRMSNMQKVTICGV
jgi:hypothetical protein